MESRVDTISLSKQRPFHILQEDFTSLKPVEIEEKAREMISNADKEDAIIVLVLDGILLQGLTRADVKYDAIRSAATKALYVHLVNHLRTTEEEALPLAMISAESLYAKVNTELNGYYRGFFKEEAPKYADLTIELVKTLSDKELKAPERQRMAEKKINSFYGDSSQ